MPDQEWFPGMVSVIIPSYNHAPYLRDAVESVLTQSYQNLELIVLDDGSKDASVEYLKSVTDPRFSFSSHENIGAHATINKGLSRARGEFFAVLNSDDMFAPSRLEKIIEEFRENPSCGLVCTWIDCINDKGKSLGVKQGWKSMAPWPVAHPHATFQATDDFLLNLVMSNFISTTSNMVFRSSVYQKLGGMRNLRFAHDWDFALRVALSYPCKILEEALMKYRIHSSNTISSHRKHMLFEIVWIYAMHLPALGSRIFGEVPNPARIQILLESINLQSNDRLLWALQAFISHAAASGDPSPELQFLENTPLRESFFSYITE